MAGLLLVAASVLAGCLGWGADSPPTTGLPILDEPSGAGASGDTPEANTTRESPELADSDPRLWQEPAGLLGPGFDLKGPVPGSAGSEPSLLSLSDGRLILSYAGCIEGESVPCVNPPVHSSNDNGTTWQPLRASDDGALTTEPHPTRGDVDVAAGPDGTLYLVTMPRLGVPPWDQLPGLALFARPINDPAWRYLGDPINEGDTLDRPWIMALPDGTLVLAWYGGQAHVKTSHDGGSTWSSTQSFGRSGAMPGSIAADPSGRRVFFPVMNPVTLPVAGVGNVVSWELDVATSLDAGASWELQSTGAKVPPNPWSSSMFGSIGFPGVGVTCDGHVVVAWSEDKTAGDAVPIGTRIVYIVSSDWGATWSERRVVRDTGASALPWLVAGAGDRFAVAYLATDQPLYPARAYTANWSVVVTVIDGLSDDEHRLVHATVAQNVHQGSLCPDGTGCAANDRSFFEYFQIRMLQDGRMAIAYPVDEEFPFQQTSVSPLVVALPIHFAIQASGDPLAVSQVA